jgi:predicted MFS family arabinose efflux permease
VTNPNTFSPLRLLKQSAPFRRLWLGMLVSALGDSLTSVALVWIVYELTASGSAIGLLLLFYLLPPTLTSLVFGSLFDRLEPRTIMIWDNVLRALLVLTIPLLFTLGILQVWMLYAFALLAGALAPASEIGTRVMIPHLVNDSDLESANAAWAFTWQVSSVIGPGLAGLLIAALGGAWVLVLDAFSFLVLVGMLLTLPKFRHDKTVLEERFLDRFAGLGTLWKYPAVVVVTFLTFVFYLAYGPLEVAAPVYSDQVLKAGPQGYGLMWSAIGVGTLFGVALAGVLARFKAGLVLPLIALLWGVCLLPLGFTASLPLTLFCLVLGGVIWGPYTVLETSLIQRVVPAALHGRVFGARLALIAPSVPIGAALAGLLLEATSAAVVILLSGLACVLAGLLGLAMYRIVEAAKAEGKG